MRQITLLFTFFIFSTFAFSQSVTTWAGKNKTSGGITGASSAANVRFNQPWGLAADANGNIYISNEGSHTIYMLNSSDDKYYLRAGKMNQRGASNGNGINAQFDAPKGIAVGAKVYIADAGNHTIRQMDNFTQTSTAQAVSVLAGKSGSSGHNDATGNAALFDTPTDVAVDSKGNIYVADQGNHCIRMITTSGVVTTYAGDPGNSGSANGDKDSKALFNYPTGLFIDSKDNIYVADRLNSRIRFIEKSSDNVSTVFKDLFTPDQVIVDTYGSIITSHGCQISGLNGTDTFRVGNDPRNCGFKNDNDTNALLDDARGIMQISATEYIFCDRDNHVLRKMAINPCDAVNASITAGGSLTFCEGGSVTLTGVTGLTNSWTWANGTSSNNSISATTAGKYSLEVSATIGSTKCTDTTSVFVKVNSNPKPVIVAANGLKFCPGDGVDLSADQVYSDYDWTTNETTNSINVTSETTIGLEVTDANGCKGTATQVTTEEHPTTIPIIAANGATEFCEGASVDLEASNGIARYLWSENSLSNSITVSTSGKYSVTATDNNGCETTSLETEITVYPLPSKPSLDNENDSIFTTAIATNYVWYLDGNEVAITSQSFYIADQSGNYSVKIVDDNGCENTSDEQSVIITGIANIGKEVMLFPNPVSSYLVVKGLDRFSYSITDITGKQRAIGTSNGRIEIPSLPSGTYLIKLSYNKGHWIRRRAVVQ